MKIVCPKCQTAYEINVPESPTKDLSAKCAVCNKKFPIKNGSLPKTSQTYDSMTGPPLATIDSELAPESTDNSLSGLLEDPQGLADSNPIHQESSDDKNLDDYLDQLLKEEFGESGKETRDVSISQPSSDSTPPAPEMLAKDDLDPFFHSLIAEENAKDSELLPEKDHKDKDLDALLDEIILDSFAGEEENEVSGSKKSANQQEAEKNNAVFWAQTFADQETMIENPEVGDTKKTSEEKPETIDQNEEESSSTKTGKLFLGGGVLAILLTGVGIYFAFQTLAPSELTQMTKNLSEVPAGLKPIDLQKNTVTQNQTGNTPNENPNPAHTTALGAGEAPPLAKDTSKSTTPPPQSKRSANASTGLVTTSALGNHTVQLSTIILVAHDNNNTKAFSFSLEAEMSDAESAQVIRSAMPVFKKITITTVEQLMEKKFFNDILYLKKKLKKDLQNNFNKTMEGKGRVNKITLKDFTVK